MAGARLKGNDLFKASRFSEACLAYGDGLEHDPYNSVLLCNRAACRSKLGQFEKGVEDCTMALNVRPSYSKARLRRADCNAKVTEDNSFKLFNFHQLTRYVNLTCYITSYLTNLNKPFHHQLGRWEASIQDYEILIRELPGDDEVSRALFEAKLQLKKERGEYVKDEKPGGSDVIVISSTDHFRHFLTLPGKFSYKIPCFVHPLL